MIIGRNISASIPLIIAVIYGFNTATTLIATTLVISCFVNWIFENDNLEQNYEQISVSETLSLIYRECSKDYRFTQGLINCVISRISHLFGPLLVSLWLITQEVRSIGESFAITQ